MAAIAVLQAVVSAPRPGLPRRHGARQGAAGARRAVISAAWSPFFSSGAEQQPERFRSLFQAAWVPPSDNPATVYDCRDALETCSGLWGEQRRECLSVFGLDADQVDAYYSTVLILEQALSHDTDPEEEALHQGQERC